MRLVREVPYLSFPAFRLQETLRMYTLGSRKWAAIERRLRKRKHESKVRAEERIKKEEQLKEQIWKFQETVQPKSLNDSARSYNIKLKLPSLQRKTKRSATMQVFR